MPSINFYRFFRPVKINFIICLFLAMLFILAIAVPQKANAAVTVSSVNIHACQYYSSGGKLSKDCRCPAPQFQVGLSGTSSGTEQSWCVTVYANGTVLNQTDIETTPLTVYGYTCPNNKFTIGRLDQNGNSNYYCGTPANSSYKLSMSGSTMQLGCTYNCPGPAFYIQCPADGYNGIYNPALMYGYCQPWLCSGCTNGLYYYSYPTQISLINPPTVNLTANPTDIYGSGTSRLSWTTTNTPTSISSNFSAWPPTSGSRQVTPSAGANYYWVRVSNSAGSASDSVYVYVHPGHFSVNQGSAECDNERSVNRISWDASYRALWYNVYRNGSYIGYVYAPTTSYNDYNVSYGNSYTYTIQAVNSQGYGTWGNNNSGTVATRYCLRPQVTISPSISSIILGQSQTLSWTAQNVNRVSIFNYGDVYNGAISSQNGTISVQPKNTTSYIIRGYNPSPYSPASASATVYVSNTQAGGSGDVYSGRILNDPNGKLTFDDRTILSVHDATINMPGSPDTIWKIPNYISLKEVLWETTKNKMHKNIDNMKNNHPNSLSAKITGPFNLDPKQTGNPNDPTPANSATGQVWYRAGNLQIGENGVETVFKGKGTIIVDGELTIFGDVNYADDNSSVGIIANTNSANAINIERTANKIIGAYFTFGTINMK